MSSSTASDAAAVAATAAQTARGNTRGILAMTVSMACFIVSDMLMKIAGRELPAGEIMVLRGLASTPIIIAVGLATGAFVGLGRALAGPQRGMLAWRTLAEIGAIITFVIGLLRLPFADASAIGQFTPLAVTAGAALFLGEQVGWRRWLATAVGLVGVLIIVQPGTTAFRWEALLIIACVLFVTARDLLTRCMDGGISAVLITTISSISGIAAGLLLVPFETWVVPTPETLAVLAGSSVLVLGGFYGGIVAMRSGEMSVVSPFRYSAIVFAVILSVLVLGEAPPWTTYLGIAIVIAAGLYMFHRERVREAELSAAAPAPRPASPPA